MLIFHHGFCLFLVPLLSLSLSLCPSVLVLSYPGLTPLLVHCVMLMIVIILACLLVMCLESMSIWWSLVVDDPIVSSSLSIPHVHEMSAGGRRRLLSARRSEICRLAVT